MPRRLIALGALILAGCSTGSGDPLEAARRALEEGRGQDAYRTARELTAGEGAPVDAWILAADACRATMRTSPGLEAAERAVEAAPDDPRAHHAKAVLDQLRRRNVAAVASAREAVRLEPEAAGRHALLGHLLLGGGMVGTADYPAAEAAFREALRLDPDCARARYGLGKTQVLAGRHADGARELDTYLAAFPLAGDAYYHRGLARMRTRDFEGAAHDFERASLLPPRPSHAFFNLAKALQRLDRAEEAEDMRRRYQLLRPLDMDIETIATTYHSHSDNLKAAFDLAGLLAQARRFDEAKTLLETLCLDNPELPRPHQMLAEVAIADLDVVRARFAAARAVEIMGDSPAARSLAARAASLAGKPEEAVAHARLAAELAPGPDTALLLGNALIETRAFADAVTVFERARRAAPQDARLVAGLGRALEGNGRAGEAEALLTQALRARPRSADWLTARGRARAAQGKARAAEEDFRTAVAVAPGHAAAYDALSSLLAGSGRSAEAKPVRQSGARAAEREEALQRAWRDFHRTPAVAEAARQVADLLRESGRPAEADHTEGRSAALREEL